MMVPSRHGSLAWFLLATLLYAVVDAADKSVHPRHCGGAVRHVHLAVGHDASTSMIVSFASIQSKYDPPVAGVLLGTSPDQLNDLYLPDDDDDDDSSPTTYNVTVDHKRWSNDEDDKTKYWAPYYHHVTITDLEPSTVYYYQPIISARPSAFQKYNIRHPHHQQKTEESLEESLKETVQGEQEGGQRRLIRWGPYDGTGKDCPPVDKIRSFRTAPPNSAVAANFAIMGDLGQFSHSEETVARLLRSREPVDAAILAGDIAYTGTDHRRWDCFFDFLDDYPFFERTPVQICPGNHDIDKLESSKEIFLAYEQRFRMPRLKPPQLGLYEGPEGGLNMDQPPYPLPYEYGNAYYSWKYAGAHFIMISSYSAMEPESKQYKFIESELESVDREATPWVFAVLHTPLYNTFSLHRRDPQILAAKEHLEPLFVKHKVNMAFTGHIHAYLRTLNVAMDKLNDKAPIHITVGAGGRKCEAPFRSAEPEEWVGARDATIYGYGMLRILDRHTAEWDWIHTGHNDDRDYNQVWQSDEQLPPGPGDDHVVIKNQYYL